jgi:preprotein translocase subunit SecG
MSIIVIKFLKSLKIFRLFISLLLLLLIFFRKADEEDSNLSIFGLTNKKSERFIDKLIWFLIIIFFITGLIFSTKSFSY